MIFLFKRLWYNVFFETWFFFQNVIWDLNCLFMLLRCFFFTLNYIWFRKYHWQIRPSKKIEHLNISMPHFQKGHEIKFFLGQTYFLLYDLLCYYHQTAWLHSALFKNFCKKCKFWEMALTDFFFFLKARLKSTVF